MIAILRPYILTFAQKRHTLSFSFAEVSIRKLISHRRMCRSDAAGYPESFTMIADEIWLTQSKTLVAPDWNVHGSKSQ